MPLNRPNGGFSSLPYSLKLTIVETNCTGCPCFKKIRTERVEESEYGCVFPRDIQLINAHIREPYLTVSEIASNTCDFWNSHTKWELETIDAREGDWNDPATVRESLRFIAEVEHQVGEEEYISEQEEIIPQLRFTDNKD
jgi:hypothetical protein